MTLDVSYEMVCGWSVLVVNIWGDIGCGFVKRFVTFVEQPAVLSAESDFLAENDVA